MWIVEVTKMVRYELAIIPNKMKKNKEETMVVHGWFSRGEEGKVL